MNRWKVKKVQRHWWVYRVQPDGRLWAWDYYPTHGMAILWATRYARSRP